MDDAIDTPPPAEDLTLIALTPADMVPAQTDLITWCDRKILAVKAELADLETNLELATAHGWKHASVQASLNRVAKRVTYYEKMKAAVEAGYVIVPNFPIDVFAVRVKRDQPRTQFATYDSSDRLNAKAELLPAGEGRYVDDGCLIRDLSHDETVDGKTRHVSQFVTSNYDAIDFPVALVKPAILHETQRAMALRIFDDMGIVQNQVGRDLIVVGRLLDPRGNRRCVTFFVAWWLDTASL